jgi:hypothetical protein
LPSPEGLPADQANSEPTFFSISELAKRWRCSRASVYNRLRGEVVLDFARPDLAPPPALTWADLHNSFKAEVERRIAIGKLRTSTWERYQQTVKAFGAFLIIQDIVELERITKTVVENFKVWRLAEIRKRKFSSGGGGLVLDAAILHRIFRHAIECDLLKSNPVRMEGRPGDQPESGAQPFTADQLSKLRKSAGSDLLAFLLLRWTGLRGSDASGLRWGEIDWGAKKSIGSRRNAASASFSLFIRSYCSCLRLSTWPGIRALKSGCYSIRTPGNRIPGPGCTSGCLRSVGEQEC